MNLVKLIYELKPDEIYHLAAQSHVRVSFDIPEYTSDVTGVGTIRILEAIRETGIRSTILPGLEQRDVRQSAGGAADRDDAVLAAQSLRRGQGFRLLGDGELPRKLRPLREQRHSLQPRKPAPRRNVRHPQNHPRGGGDKARPAKGTFPRQPRCQTRLGLRAGVRRRHVAHSAARRGRRFRPRDERDAHQSANFSRSLSAASISIGRNT